ncbi:dehydrodolichyl diphosphate synthase complex subunit DHDDS-like [Anneissia japonica]|uniref:dehydrodolichyl diphosphate synthase complex subunit DHDDS-like n=1 Tax=Anneissia japonica TaxID=1529436 RepID=UPI0014259858|nr:dehydrodolichyl diphosphate synthase complex subunit DHDDS-like [Anneissia japonica]
MATVFKDEKDLPPMTWLHKFCCRILKAGPIPKHVAIIMDGNRRFAKKHQYDSTLGHAKGFDKLAETLMWCSELGINEVTIYAFSIENFKRSKEEVNYIMDLAREKFHRLQAEKEQIRKHGVCVRIIGDITRLPQDLQKLAADIVYFTRNNTRAILNVCLAYTSRNEITNAIKDIAGGVESGLLFPSDSSEELIEKCLYTNHSKDPDLLIRTSGETRLSDFLLWQSSYTVLSFTEVLWPEFTIWHLFGAVLHYQRNFQSVQTAKELSAAERRREVLESDKQCVLHQLQAGNTTCSSEDKTLQNKFQEKLAQYTIDREQRIAVFLNSVEKKRELYIKSILEAD